jgi:hypothetical protein
MGSRTVAVALEQVQFLGWPNCIHAFVSIELALDLLDTRLDLDIRDGQSPGELCARSARGQKSQDVPLAPGERLNPRLSLGVGEAPPNDPHSWRWSMRTATF